MATNSLIISGIIYFAVGGNGGSRTIDCALYQAVSCHGVPGLVGSLVARGDDGPVDDLPQFGEVVGAAVLVVEVVGVLPDVEGEEGAEALGEGVAGAGLLGDGERAVCGGSEPDPAGAEEAGALGGEVGLEGVERAPLGRDAGLEGARRRVSGGLRAVVPGLAGGLELAEVHIVVEDLAGVVENRAGRSRADDLLQRQAFELAAGQELVQIGDVTGKVLAVVELQRPGADHRLERIQRIGQVNQCKHSKCGFAGRRARRLRLCPKAFGHAEAARQEALFDPPFGGIYQ